LEATVKKLYEAMFLIDSAEAAADWEAVNATIRNILERAGVEIVSIKKWDERKLTYDIKGKSRGTYVLCYFRGQGQSIRQIERDVRLSERIMRVLILRADQVLQEEIEKDTHAVSDEKRRQTDAHAAEQVSAQQAEQSGESEQSAESSTAAAGESEQLEQADAE
jgi:small subunit ribosomal protein S6